MTGRWWRTNWYWLPLVPVAAVAMLAASAYHVRTFWYEQGLHHAVATAKPGQYVSVDIPYEDTAGRTAYRFRVRVDGVTKVGKARDDAGELDVPKGATAYRIRMSYTADPSVALRFCELTLVDTQGRQYDERLGQDKLCVPENHPGPYPALFKGNKRGAMDKGDARPTSWTRSPVILVGGDARPAQVRLWFALPDYVSLPLPR